MNSKIVKIPNKNKKTLGLAIFTAIIGTFTAIIGMIVWAIGFLSLNPKYVKSKKFLIVWSLATFGIVLFYLLTLINRMASLQ